MKRKVAAEYLVDISNVSPFKTNTKADQNYKEFPNYDDSVKINRLAVGTLSVHSDVDDS